MRGDFRSSLAWPNNRRIYRLQLKYLFVTVIYKARAKSLFLRLFALHYFMVATIHGSFPNRENPWLYRNGKSPLSALFPRLSPQISFGFFSFCSPKCSSVLIRVWETPNKPFSFSGKGTENRKNSKRVLACYACCS